MVILFLYSPKNLHVLENSSSRDNSLKVQTFDKFLWRFGGGAVIDIYIYIFFFSKPNICEASDSSIPTIGIVKINLPYLFIRCRFPFNWFDLLIQPRKKILFMILYLSLYPSVPNSVVAELWYCLIKNGLLILWKWF